MEYGQEHQIPVKVPENPGTASFTSQQCLYVTTEIYNVAVTNRQQVATIHLMDNRHLLQIADRVLVGTPAQMTGAPGVPPTYSNTTGDNLKARIAVKGSCVYTLRNQSTEPMQFSLFYCRPRGNINFDQAAFPNIYSWLATGFANNGLDNTHVNADTNITMNQACFSPFNSFDFTRDFNIDRVRNVKIQPGQMRKFSLKTGQTVYRPADIAQIVGAGSGNWLVQSPKYVFNKHERFIMFKAWGQPAGWGTAPTAYMRLIQMTAPGFVLHSKFRYECYKVSNTLTPSTIVEASAIFDNSAAAAPSIIVPDAAVKGVVTVAL